MPVTNRWLPILKKANKYFYISISIFSGHWPEKIRG